jgi:hypothetical protein
MDLRDMAAIDRLASARCWSGLGRLDKTCVTAA